MPYKRPQSEIKLSAEEKKDLLREYMAFYQTQVQMDIANLNKKIPREVFGTVLDEIGTILWQKSVEMVKEDAAIQRFLKETPLPPELEKLLPDDLRVFCMMLNALKQWVSAEQQATDRYLLGGTARRLLRSVADECMVTGKGIEADGELHHPVRDGRPPILLSKEGHSIIERPVSTKKTDSEAHTFLEKLTRIKKQGKHSWVQLRRGCMDYLGLEVEFTSPGVRNTSRSFAKNAHENAGLSYQEILDWLDENALGFLSAS